MLNIAILDDMQEEAAKVKELLCPYFQHHNIDYGRIDIFHNGKELLHAQHVYDLLFLDIEVGNENGIEIAKIIRKSHPNILIIVVTNYIRYSIEGYKIQAARYLLKPIAASLLYSELDEVLSDYMERPSIHITGEDQEYRLRMMDLYYFESFGRKVQFHTRGEAYVSRENVSYWATILQKQSFVECYKGVYVNLRYIISVGKETLQLENKQVLPLARRRVESVHTAWISFQGMML